MTQETIWQADGADESAGMGLSQSPDASGRPTEQSSDDGRYVMRISRLTIDKLGIKMYDRVAAVLAELIANSYDADAETVEVRLPFGTWLDSSSATGDHEDYEVLIRDDGHGMTRQEVNDFYLTVGADRRKRTLSDKSREKLRPVMGRKGIGKLAPFGICETVEVLTAGGTKEDRGYRVSHLILRLGDMLNDTDEQYYPEPGPQDNTWLPDRGTTIRLRNFQRRRVPVSSELDRQLASRFGVQRADWRVAIINSNDRADKFYLGQLKVDILPGTRVDVSDYPVIVGDKALPVTGWLAYSKVPYRDVAMAGVRIYARGKIVAQTRDFEMKAGFTGEYKMRSYLVGEIHAEWLDDEDDLVRSDRQDIIWSSERGEAFTAWGQRILRDIAKRSEADLKEQQWEDFQVATKLDHRLEQIAPGDPKLREAVTDAAKLLAENSDRAALADPDHANQLLDLAVQLAPHSTLIDALHDASLTADSTLAVVIALFDKARIAEMYSLGQVATERIAVVSRLEALVADGAALERPLQELIEQAPWLLAPEWTPLGMNESLQRVRSHFEAWYKKQNGTEISTTAINRPLREPDFVLLHDSGKLWVVEIKRMDYHLTGPEYERGLWYLNSLTKFLNDNPSLGEQFPVRRLTFVVDHIDTLPATAMSSLESDPRVSRRTWHELLDDTKRAHRDFLGRVEEIRISGEH